MSLTLGVWLVAGPEVPTPPIKPGSWGALWVLPFELLKAKQRLLGHAGLCRKAVCRGERWRALRSVSA